MNTRLFTFTGGKSGPWRITRVETAVGEPLIRAARLDVTAGPSLSVREDAQWSLRGITSNDRYVTQQEKEQLLAKQPTLGRLEATCAALIPIRKNALWWSLTQDQRRAIFEESSNHIEIALKYLPAVARRLHHCRDLDENEPFDFLTWFEFAPADSAAFDELVAILRASEEWKYVEREIDIRVIREPA